MPVYGCDFTSAPSTKKPIVVAELDKDNRLVQFLTFDTLLKFENFLSIANGVIGIDAPFGMPALFLEFLDFKGDWATLANYLETKTPKEMQALADTYKTDKVAGEKEPKRTTDIVNRSASPAKFIFNPPVGRMAIALMPILARNEISVWPCRELKGDLTAVEVYPAVYARKVVGNQSYKNIDSVERHARRNLILNALRQDGINLASNLERLILDDFQADYLDALIAARTALEFNFPKLPVGLDLREGWIFTTNG